MLVLRRGRKLKQVAPQRFRAAEVPVDARPKLSDLCNRSEKPNVSCVGFAEQGAKPIRALIGSPLAKSLAQVTTREIGPPQEVGFLAIIGQVGGGGG
jgi:hypothetical protein